MIMKRLTKIVATIGPASESDEMIEKLIEAGVDIFRFNFKHNSVEWHEEMIKRVNSVAKKINRRVGTLIDLQGPEIRINIPVEQMEIDEGEMLYLGEEVFEDKDKKGFSISHPDIIEHLKDGQDVIADDGAFEFRVVKKDGAIYLLSKTTGVLKTRKSFNIPGADFPFPVLIDRDFDGLRLAERQEVDYVALSFVRSAKDLGVLREEMSKFNIKAKVVSKIETQKALDHLEEIVDATDGIMVARGDLGVELPFEQVPYWQKKLIEMSIEKGKFVITATQMLESMIVQPRATRAEISDIANATYDLTDAVMLSAESASGKHPLRAVQAMRRTVEFNEKKQFIDTRVKFQLEMKDPEGLICDAAYDLYQEMFKKEMPVVGFMVFTHTGRTARLMSMFRPRMPIFAFCPDTEVAEGLTVNYGVYPIVEGKTYKQNVRVTHNHVLAGMKYLIERGFIKNGDRLIVLHGDFWAVEGGTSTVKLVKADI